MTLFIGIISQKGGVGKSTLCRMIATVYAASGWKVKIADTDTKQATCADWKRRREDHGFEPLVYVEAFRRIDDAIRNSDGYDLMLFDGAPHSTESTATIAKQSDLVILPTSDSIDSLRPSVLLAHELVQKGINANQIVFALCMVSDSDSLIQEAKTYIKQAGYEVLAGEIPIRAGYVRAHGIGRSLAEANHPSLREKAEKMAESIVAKVEEMQKGEK
jgi:chromosome partitioning protein